MFPYLEYAGSGAFALTLNKYFVFAANKLLIEPPKSTVSNTRVNGRKSVFSLSFPPCPFFIYFLSLSLCFNHFNLNHKAPHLSYCTFFRS